MITVKWLPPSGGSAFLFDSDPYALIGLTGVSSTIAAPVTQKGAGQVGTTLTGVTVDARTIGIVAELATSTEAAFWSARQALTAAFVMLPPSTGVLPVMGTLQFSRDGLQDLIIPAMPATSPDILIKGPTFAECDLSFYCPYPFFKELADVSALLQAAGGFTFPIAHPFSMLSYNVTTVVTNAGTVAAPPLMRLYGDCTNPTLTNNTTGAVMALTGHILAGDYVEIVTEYGIKSITYVTAGGVRTNKMSWLNIAGATVPDMFWSLIPGQNSVSFGAGTNVSGLARIFWRQRYAGL